MQLILKCKCGSTDFDYVGTDLYECTQCSRQVLLEIDGDADLEPDKSTHQHQKLPNIKASAIYCVSMLGCENCKDRWCCHCANQATCLLNQLECKIYQRRKRTGML